MIMFNDNSKITIRNNNNNNNSNKQKNQGKENKKTKKKINTYYIQSKMYGETTLSNIQRKHCAH